MFIDELLECFFLCAANDLVDRLATLEYDEGGDAHHAVFGRAVWVFVNVAFADNDVFAGVFRSQFLDDRTHHLAWSAPGCPEINEDGRGRVKDFGLERGVREVFFHMNKNVNE